MSEWLVKYQASNAQWSHTGMLRVRANDTVEASTRAVDDIQRRTVGLSVRIVSVREVSDRA
jgi:hypothetical protein